MLTEDLLLESGPVRGIARNQDGVLAFKGIPYAAPPVGALRWRSPQNVPRWKGVRDATKYGSSCLASPLPALGWLTKQQSEDCLTVNVWTAAREANEKRPAMVWIHGGGFEFGSSALPGTDGAHLAAQGVVLVSFNYRLGVFGFLAHPELDAEGSPSGNFGLQDQIKALQWVKENIARFGGDPDNVTIFGESAGAHAVGLLMASPRARGLFHKAIGQSGAYWDSEHGSISTRSEALARGREFVTRLGASSVDQLRTLPAAVVQKVGKWNFLLDPGTTAFAPSIDGFIVQDAPGAIFERGEQAHIPLLAGWNKEEHTYFMSRALPAKSGKALRAAAAAQFGEARLADFTAAYPNDSKAESAQSAELLIGDLVITQQTWEWLGAHRASSGAPTFAYYFEYTSAYSPVAAHTAEIPFVFGAIDQAHPMGKGASAAPRDRELSDQMVRYWTNFARTGDPNEQGMAAWPEYRGAGGSGMRFGMVSEASPEVGTERFHFIRSFRADGRLPESWRQAKGRLPASLAAPLAKVILCVSEIQSRLRPK